MQRKKTHEEEAERGAIRIGTTPEGQIVVEMASADGEGLGAFLTPLELVVLLKQQITCLESVLELGVLAQSKGGAVWIGEGGTA